VQGLSVLWESGKLNGIDREVSGTVHVVLSIKPQRLQWDIVILVILGEFLDVGKIVPHFGCTVPAERPEWRKLGKPNESLVVGNNLSCRAPTEENDIKISSSCNIAQNMGIVPVGDDWRLSVSVPEKDTKELIFVVKFDQGEWMHSSELLATSAIIVFSLILHRPHGPRSSTQMESSES